MKIETENKGPKKKSVIKKAVANGVIKVQKRPLKNVYISVASNLGKIF